MVSYKKNKNICCACLLYFWAGIIPSMDSPFSSFFSISTISLTPSTTSWTCSTSEEPRRSALEMSNTPPTEAVSTPPGLREKKTKKSSFLRMFWDFFDYFSTNESRNANSCCCGTCATFLQTQSGQDFLKLGLSAQLRQLDVHATTQACSKVGRASQDVSQMLVPHETVVVLLKDLLNLAKEMPGSIFLNSKVYR